MALEIMPTRKIEVVKLQVNAKLTRSRLHHAQALGHDFLTDAVTGNHGYFLFACFYAHAGAPLKINPAAFGQPN